MLDRKPDGHSGRYKLLSVRVYRDAWTHDKAIGLLREQSGSAFDPGCVAALERLLARDALVLGVAV
jgi:HD-GYP domain-containing protein (c-di-GMP phosphodiesterase class II)